MRLNKQKTRFFLPLLYMTVLFAFSSVPASEKPTASLQSMLSILSPFIQNFLHMPAFGVLAVSWYWALQALYRETKFNLKWAFILTAMYAVFDEWHQFYVSGRSASLMDVLLDFVGAAIALFFLYVYGNRPFRAQS